MIRLLHLTVLLTIVLSSMANVFGQELEVKSGFWRLSYYENDEEVGKERFLETLRTDTEANLFWKKAKTSETLAYTSLVLGTGFGIWNYRNISNNEVNILSAIGGIVTSAAALVFLIRTSKNKTKAVATYNRNIKKGTALKVRPSSKGLGLALVFQ